MGYNKGRPEKIRGKDCDICYESNRITTKCFWGCSICICTECITEMIKLSRTGHIFFKCPQCARRSFNIRFECWGEIRPQEQANIKFGYLCTKSTMVTHRIFDIYEDYYSNTEHKEYETDEDDFNYIEGDNYIEGETVVLLPGQLPINQTSES